MMESGKLPTDFDPRPDPEIVNRQFSPAVYPRSNDSEDADSSLSLDGLPGQDETHEPLDLDETIRLFSALLKHSGSKNVPVVDVQYDLSAVQRIPDPSEFMRERWDLYQIVERATRRMLRESSDSSGEEPEEVMPKERLYRPHHHHADASRPGLHQTRQPEESPYVAPAHKEVCAPPVREKIVTDLGPKALPTSNKPSPHSSSNGLPTSTEKTPITSQDLSGEQPVDEKPPVNGRSPAKSPVRGRDTSIEGLGKGRGPKSKGRPHAQGKLHSADKRGGVKGKAQERTNGALPPRRAG